MFSDNELLGEFPNDMGRIKVKGDTNWYMEHCLFVQYGYSFESTVSTLPLSFQEDFAKQNSIWSLPEEDIKR